MDSREPNIVDIAENDVETKKANKALPIVIFTVFIDLLGFSIVLPILAPLLALPYRSTILPNMSYSDRLIVFGFLVGSYALAQFLATPIIGQLSDRYGRKPLLAFSLMGTFLARIVFIIGILRSDIALLFLSRIVDGITGGNISVAQSSVADISTPQNRVKNFGLIGAAFGLGFVLGPYLGGRLGDASLVNGINNLFSTQLFTSSTLPLWFATILCGINVLLMIRIFPETLKHKVDKPLRLDSSIRNIVKAFTVGNIRITFITVFLLFLGFSFFTQFLSVYIGTKFSPQIIQTVKDRIQNGDIPIQLPPNLPDSQKDSFQQQVRATVNSINEKELKNNDEIVYPDTIEAITNTKAKSDAEKHYNEILSFTKLQIEAESQKRASDSFSYIGIWVVISQALIARQLSKRFKPATLLKAGLLLNGMAALILLFPDKIEFLFLILPLIAISNGLTQPNSSAIVSNSADAKSQGEVLGINASIQSLAQALPPIISGFISAKLSASNPILAISAPVLVGAILIFAAFIVFSLYYKPQSKEHLSED